jgi:hypothetical protein
MRSRHLKSRFQMLRHKKLNEVIATDTYFANEKSIQGYHCAQVFFEMTSKMMYVAGMKTESEFADVYLDFIRKYGIPSAFRRDHAKSEMSQRIKDIHRDLIIQDYLSHFHNLSANRQLNWKIPEQVSRREDTRHIPCCDVLLF